MGVQKQKNKTKPKIKAKYELSSPLCLLLKLNNLENWVICTMLDKRIIGSMYPFSTSDVRL